MSNENGTRRIEFVLPRRNVIASADLHWDSAPRTCEAVWAALAEPIQGLTYHAIFAGFEIYTYCPQLHVPVENDLREPAPGQIAYFELPPRVIEEMPVHKGRLGAGGGAEFAIWYGEGDLRRILESGQQGNLFAQITIGLDDFASACWSILQEGIEDITVRRAN
jgi:hypothetical protein